MNKIKVSHESPLQLLELSREYNDYDYCLVHLLEQHPKYHDFFFESKKIGRHILLDNSIFELGTAFDIDKFAEWVTKLGPNEYIVPDVLEDTNGTIKNFEKWNNIYKDLPGTKIGVVQGKTYAELVECYKFMSEYADKLAISFDYSFYQTTGYDKIIDNKWSRFMSGRMKFIRDLYLDEIWNFNKPHHLLGCALPKEFKYYVTNEWGRAIESLDTSNPIVAGINFTYYNDDGLYNKITTKLADLIEAPIIERQLDIIKANIKKFKDINLL